MDLTYFPMDSQLCMLEMESYGYTMADLVYEWADGINSVEVRKVHVRHSVSHHYHVVG